MQATIGKNRSIPTPATLRHLIGYLALSTVLLLPTPTAAQEAEMENTTVTASFVDESTIQLRFALGAVVDASQTALPDGYTYNPDSDGWVWDDGWIGRVQLDGTTYMPTDTYLASAIDDLFDAPDGNGLRKAAVDNQSRWTVKVDGQEVAITGLSRKSHLTETATVGWGEYEFSTLQNVFLTLDEPLSKGNDLRITFDDVDFDPIRTTYDAATTISEALHVNLMGFDPQDGHKIAYLSSWNGWDVDPDATGGGTPVAQVYDGPRGFQVIDAATGGAAFTGQTQLGTPADLTNDGARNFAQTDVWEMDFAALTDAGDYYIVVDGVGRSQTFTIADSHWDAAFQIAFKGFYHQRSGIELTDEFTDWTHPRSLHPDDGLVTVYASTLKITDTDEGYDYSKPDQFGPLVDQATDEVLTDAWGGWHDAGDWDRRTQHIEAARELMDIVEIAPDWAASVDGGIPESGDGIPDLLDEAIWGLSVFARMQTDDGGIRGGIEGDNYRGYGAASWTEEHTLYAYAPDAWSSWEFAAAAAKLARVLAPYDSEQATSWLEKAEAAWDWAEANIPAEMDHTLITSRNLAAVELYGTTEETDYHDVFLATTTHTPANANNAWDIQQYEAIFAYQRLDDSLTDADVKAASMTVLRDQADYLLAQGMNMPFGNIIDPAAPYGWGNTAQAPLNAADFMIPLHALTGDDTYLRAIMSDVQYVLGANPMNMTYVTGVDGARGPQELLSADADATGTAPPPGITLYGDFNIFDYGQHDAYDTMWNDIFPNPYQTPIHESHQGYWGFVPSTEYTVQQGIVDLTYVTAYLAGLQDSLPPDTDQDWGAAPNVTLPQGMTPLQGTKAADVLKGTAENDAIRGGQKADVLKGLAGRDLLMGQKGADILGGSTGNDVLEGGNGNDALNAGRGHDWLSGGKGADMLRGGNGRDTFVLMDGDGRDVITDFLQGIDRIALDAALWAATPGPEDMLDRFGTVSQGRNKIVLDFGDGDALVIRSGDAITLSDLADDLILI